LHSFGEVMYGVDMTNPISTRPISSFDKGAASVDAKTLRPVTSFASFPQRANWDANRPASSI